jgi:polar amino acid transport system substrate-binding protein
MLTRLFSLCLFFMLFAAEAASQELKIAMGSNLSPMHFIDASGKLTGFEVDLVNLYAKEQNLHPAFLDPAKYNSSSLELVQSGKADMAVNCISITDERRKLVDFSKPYFLSGTALLVNKNSGEVFNFYKRTYIVIKNSLYSKQLAERYLPNRKEVKSVDEALALVQNEKLHRYLPYTFVFDWTALQEIANKKENIKLMDFVVATEEYAAAFKKGGINTTWNSFITKIRQDGRYEKLRNRWFSGKQLPHLSTIPQRQYQQGSGDWARPLSPDDSVFEAYLPLLGSEMLTSRHGPSWSGGDKYYDYLVKKYNNKWLPHLEELFYKAYPENRLPLFYEFVAERDIVELLPAFYSRLQNTKQFQTREIDRVLAVFSVKHPELRDSIEKAYDRHLEQRTVHISFTPGCLDENNSEIDINLLADSKRSKPITINISMGHDAEIKLLPSKPGGGTRLAVNGITGTLKEMTLSGDTSMSIFHVEKGQFASFSLPDGCEYAGISSDGNTIYLDFEKLRLFLDVASKKVTKIGIANPLRSTAALDNRIAKAGGFTDCQIAKSLGKDYYLKQTTGEEVKTTVYKCTPSSAETKVTTFSGGAPSPIFLDSKLFSAQVGYDICTPFNVIDLKTGVKSEVGSCGGLVPVGAHEIYYCASGWHQRPDESWLVNTETLAKKKVRSLPCPGKTGRFEPHPLPGYFIYFSWSLC